jgi:hypothetical protein
VAVCVADMNFHSGDPIAESIKSLFHRTFNLAG